jgi:hypothetical protein
MHHRMIKITDSALILYGEEGPEAIDIDRFSFDPQNGYIFTPAVQHAYGLKTIKLTIIDEEKRIAVEEEIMPEWTRYNLMVDADKLTSLPIIINYCPTQKAFEFDFPKTDWKELIRTKK